MKFKKKNNKKKNKWMKLNKKQTYYLNNFNLPRMN